jgi:hypothetical protein
VIEYTITVAGQDAPELFALITDLTDHAAYPAEALAAAYHWRWIGSETCLKEAKSAISGAGPSTGAMLRSQSPALIAQEHAAWVAATELARAAARAWPPPPRPPRPASAAISPPNARLSIPSQPPHNPPTVEPAATPEQHPGHRHALTLREQPEPASAATTPVPDHVELHGIAGRPA